VDELTRLLTSYLNDLFLAALSPVVLLAILIYVFSWNYRRLRRDPFDPDMLNGEEAVDRLSIRRRLSFSETWLTDQRVIQAKASWLFSSRKVKALALEDVNSVKLHRLLNVILLALALFFWKTLNPLALALFLLGLENPLYVIRFETPFAQMPWTRVSCWTFYRRHLTEVIRFWRNAVATWSQRRLSKALPAPIEQASLLETIFAWGRPVWCYVGFYFVLGILQRITEPHVSFDDYVFFPLYLALPAAVASRSGRDSVWSSILGFLTLLTVVYPSNGKLLGFMFSDYHGQGIAVQQLLILVFMVLIAFAAWLIAKHVHGGLTFLPPLLWLLLIAWHMPQVSYNLALYAKVLLAMFAVPILSYVDGRLFQKPS